MSAIHPDEASRTSPAKYPGAEPLPGYVLIEPLGRGGFGEVWKAEVPGGLHKAIKFVASDPGTAIGGDESLKQEFEAFQQIKEIRHPFLLTIERVELVEDELVMVMELADRHIGERFHECRAQRLPGIPRDELLGYLREAAEALDVISARYGLQHLDIKPANLFLTAGHVQVGDYGLVSKLDGGAGPARSRGMTPRYAAPEVLCGGVHTRSDQYSLALVYQELLTGTFPFSATSARQFLIQHVSSEPDLFDLPAADRATVGIALAKNPDDRFASCREFIDTLAGGLSAALTPTSGTVTKPLARLPGVAVPGLPKLVALGPARPASSAAVLPPPAPNVPTPAPPVSAREQLGVTVPAILSVVPVDWLRGRKAPDPTVAPVDLVRAVLAAAGAGPAALEVPGSVQKQPDGTWACRFLTTNDPRMAKVKLDLVWEKYEVTMDTRDPYRVVFKKPAPGREEPPAGGGLFGRFGKKPPSGLEVTVELPEQGGRVGEVVVRGHTYGTPPAEFARVADRAITKIIEGVRKQLGNVEERRKHPRVPAGFPVVMYPLTPDGKIGAQFHGKCRDVSAGGLSLVVKHLPPENYMYVVFDGVAGAAGFALLFRIVQCHKRDDGVLVTGRYRLDLCPAANAAITPAPAGA